MIDFPNRMVILVPLQDRSKQERLRFVKQGRCSSQGRAIGSSATSWAAFETTSLEFEVSFCQFRLFGLPAAGDSDNFRIYHENETA